MISSCCYYCVVVLEKELVIQGKEFKFKFIQVGQQDYVQTFLVHGMYFKNPMSYPFSDL